MVNDINIFDYTVLLLALIAAETAMALSLIIGSRGLSGRLSVRNNVSNAVNPLPLMVSTGVLGFVSSEPFTGIGSDYLFDAL